MDEKVVLFPKGFNGSPPQSMEEIRAKLRQNREILSIELTSQLTDFVLTEVVNTGYNLLDDDNEIRASMMLVHESIRALLLRLDGIEHPLQEVADHAYLMDENDDEVDSSEIVE